MRKNLVSVRFTCSLNAAQSTLPKSKVETCWCVWSVWCVCAQKRLPLFPLCRHRRLRRAGPGRLLLRSRLYCTHSWHGTTSHSYEKGHLSPIRLQLHRMKGMFHNLRRSFTKYRSDMFVFHPPRPTAISALLTLRPHLSLFFFSNFMQPPSLRMHAVI